MDKWIKENKFGFLMLVILIILIVEGIILLYVVLTTSSYEPSNVTWHCIYEGIVR
jgi:hypothetical protein